MISDRDGTILYRRHGGMGAALLDGGKEISETVARQDLDAAVVEVLQGGKLTVAAELALDCDDQTGH